MTNPNSLTDIDAMFLKLIRNDDISNIKKNKCPENPTMTLFSKFQVGPKKTFFFSLNPLSCFFNFVLTSTEFNLDSEGFPEVDAPNNTIALMSYFNKEADMCLILHVYKNLFANGQISPDLMICIILVCGFDMIALFGPNNKLNIELWFKSLRGNSIRYKDLSLLIGQLIVHHKFKSIMDEWSKKSEIFNVKIITILIALEEKLIERNDVYLTYFADLLSIIRGQLSHIDNIQENYDQNYSDDSDQNDNDADDDMDDQETVEVKDIQV
jgi:hypothetical protein